MQLQLRLLVLIGVFAIPVACKPEQPAQQTQKKTGTSDANNNDDPFGTPSDDDLEFDDDSKNDDCFDLTGKKTKSLALVATYTWDVDIEEIVDEYCLSCHGSESENGDFSTYNKASAMADEIGDWVDREMMPPEGSKQLSSTEREKLLEWVELGAPETDADSEDEDEEDDSSSSDCEDDEDEDEDEDEDDRDDDGDISDLDGDWDELLAQDEVDECKDKGKIYDRTNKECHIADIAESYDCTRSGVIKAFDKVGIDVTSALDNMDSDDFELDQCGERNDDPIVFFISKTEDEESIGLKVRKLCKKGSSVCQ